MVKKDTYIIMVARKRSSALIEGDIRALRFRPLQCSETGGADQLAAKLPQAAVSAPAESALRCMLTDPDLIAVHADRYHVTYPDMQRLAEIQRQHDTAHGINRPDQCFRHPRRLLSAKRAAAHRHSPNFYDAIIRKKSYQKPSS